ncbi:MAG TPA: hypothetical protein VEW25_07845 [Allosphingosinicella sp.]|nr:hypothetical protein [Allosphingosinicella sp.]
MGHALAAGAMLAAGAAEAQRADPTRVQILTPDCERSRGGDEIVVCGQRDEPRSRYRVPEVPDTGFDPEGDVESVSRERNALMEPGARTGIGSCSNVGPGGFTGCQSRHFERQIDQYGGNPPSARNGYRRGRR